MRCSSCVIACGQLVGDQFSLDVLTMQLAISEYCGEGGTKLLRIE